MMLPPPADRGIVVFKVWPALEYSNRLILSFLLIAFGLIFQVATSSLIAGIVLIAAGNLFLLVNGYDNRVDFGRYHPRAQWERAELKKLDELIVLDRRMRQWDLSSLDVTNALGAVLFVFLVGPLAVAACFLTDLPQILAVDALVLLVPHWLTGARRILTRPQLMIKVNTIRRLLRETSRHLRDHRVDVLMLLAGEEQKLPQDVKFKVAIKDHHADFLGLYGQVVLNEVQGKSYPYFYVVLVARRGFGLEQAESRAVVRGAKVTIEFKCQDEVEVLVLRQTTTRTSGYHTKRAVAQRILLAGLDLAEKVAKGPAAATK